MILDTCALLWLAEGGGSLSREALSRIDDATELYVCAITGFEIGLKCRTGKLVLPARPAEWFETVLAHHGVEVLPLDLATCVLATELPTIHADPCDRFIIAAARLRNLPVVTHDRRFKDYGIDVIG